MIFDVGGVLFRPVAGAVEGIAAEFGVGLPDLMPLLSGPESIETSMGDSPFDTTAMVSVATERLVPLLGERAHPAAKQLMDLYRDRSPGRRNDAVIGLLPKLKAAGLRVGILSNGPSDAYPVEWLSACGWVDTMVISGIDGVGKPSPQAYRLVLDRLATTPGNSWFVDDSAGNVEAARRLGFTAVQFRGDVHELEEELRAGGLVW